MKATSYESIEKILLPLDCIGDANDFIPLVNQLFLKHNAQIHVLKVVDSNFLGSGTAFSGKFIFHGNEVMKSAHEQVGDFVNSLKENGISDVSFEVIVGGVQDVVDNYIQNNGIDLVVMHLPKSERTKRYFNTDSYRVISKCAVPVLAVPRQGRFTRFKKIIYPVRPVDGVISKLNTLVPLVSDSEAVVHLVGISEGESHIQVESIKNAMQFLKVRIRRRKLTLGGMDSLVSETPSKTILKISKSTKPDLIVVNVTTHKPFRKWFHRNFTQNLVYSSQVPVLFYKKREPEDLLDKYVQMPYPMFPV